MIYSKNLLNQTCDYWLITPNQQKLWIETNILYQRAITPANISCFPTWTRIQRNVFQDVFKTCLQYVFQKRLQDVFQGVFKTGFQGSFKENVLQLCLEDVFKTSWRCLGRQKNVTLKMSSPRRMFPGTNQRAGNYKITSLTMQCQLQSIVWLSNETIYYLVRFSLKKTKFS